MKRLCLMLICLIPFSANAELYFSGFASIVGGKTISGDSDRFLADYSSVGAYGDELDFQPESMVGLQAMADLGDGLRFTTQFVARGLTGFNAEVDYAYLTYELTPSLILQAGRKRLPLQYYSEFFDVGYAYPWIRPPADLYTWQVLNYNGVSLTQKMQIGSSSLNTTVFTGRENSEENRLLSSYFFGEPTNEVWKNIFGIQLDWNQDIFQVLASVTTFDQDRFFTDPNTTETNRLDEPVVFSALAVNIDSESWFLLTEYNNYDSDVFKTANWLASVGMRMNTLTPFLSLSKFKEDQIGTADFEEHSTTSVGLRYDFHPQAAFKVQFDDIKDEGTLALEGDAQALTFGIDLVF